MARLRTIKQALLPGAVLVALSAGCSLQKPLPEPQVEEKIDVEVVRSSWPVGRLEAGLAFDPYYADGQIYLADGRGWVKSIEAEQASKRWLRKLDKPLSAGPKVAGEKVFVADRKGGFYALNREDGEPLWEAQLSSEILAEPRMTRGVVIARAGNGRLYGLDAESGERLWMFERSVPPLTLRQRSAPAVSGSSVVVGLEGGRLVALDVTDGSVRWEHTLSEPRGRTELERMRDIAAEPVIDRGAVYAVAYQGELAAVRMATGSSQWSRSVSSFSGFLLDNEEIYLAGTDGRVWSFDRRNGATAWRQEKLEGLSLTRPVAYGDYLVVGDNAGYVNWLRLRDGELMARTRLSSVPIERTPVVTSAEDGLVWVIDSRGRITALRVD
ncbi:outer membrane protein YfgL [Halorhodospira halochloris]|uniref:Outer membrane protein assembly factor BamB n=1 Tax=Halorhodospira halochloris TaxID=1052 RepID=A0A0X8XA74_HALHR|nr:outer membrane protein assembly factor BamB [Halorhodospira halochloris]BAU57738.2 outer membrane protein YfgL [Halorhodospira halochloris]